MKCYTEYLISCVDLGFICVILLLIFQIIRFLSSSFSEKIPIGQPIDGNGIASVSECYIGPTTRLFLQSAGEAHVARSERPVIKRSVIGEKCVVGPKSKIISSLLMDGCQIGAGYGTLLIAVILFL